VLSVECIAVLLKNGADARCADHDDNTPMDMALNDRVKSLLEKSLRHLDISAEKRGMCVRRERRERRERNLIVDL